MASTEDTNAAAEALESIQEAGAASGPSAGDPQGSNPPAAAASVQLQQLASAASTQNVEADASKYDLKDLLDMKKEKSPIFSHLNFTGLDPKLLNKLFPVISGDLLPPKEMRTSSAHMTTWRRMSKDEQKKYKERMKTAKSRQLRTEKRSKKKGKSTSYDPDAYVNWNTIDGTPAPPLSQPIDFLEGRLGDVKLFFSQLPPEDFDWTSNPLLKQTFPPHSHFGALRPPVCLLLDAQSSQDKLTVINWWRFLTKQQQGEVNKQLMDVYCRPTVSNDKLPPGFHEKMAELAARSPKAKPYEAKEDPNNNDWYMVRNKKDKPAAAEREMCCRGWSGEKFDVVFQKCYAEAVKSVTMKGGAAKTFDSISVPESVSEAKHAKDLVFLREGDDYILRSVDCTKRRSNEGKKNSPFCLPCQNVKKAVHEIKNILLRPRKDTVEKQTELIKNLKNDLRRALRREKRLRTKLEGPKQHRLDDDESSDDEAPSPKRLRHGTPTNIINLTTSPARGGRLPLAGTAAQYPPQQHQQQQQPPQDQAPAPQQQHQQHVPMTAYGREWGM